MITGKFYAKNEVNTGRQAEMDVLKAILITGMIGVHILEEIAPNVDGAGAYLLLEIGNKFTGATLFMFLMGMSSVYSKNQNPKSMLLRGFFLLTFGALLNLMRYVLPATVEFMFTRDPAGLLEFSLVASNDIMQFAGLAFLTEGLLHRLKLDDCKIMLAALLMSIAGYFLRDVSTGHYGTDQLLGYLWGTRTDSYFPLFYWFIFVAAGRLYGLFYKHLADKRAWAKRVLPAGVIISAVYLLIATSPDQNVFWLFSDSKTGFNWMLPQDALFVLIGNVTMVSLTCLLVRKESPVFLSFIGRNLNQFYCVSWFFIESLKTGLSISGVGFVEGTGNTVMVSLLIFALTYAVVLLYQKRLKTYINGFFGKHSTFWIVLIWITVAVLFIVMYVPGVEYGSYPNMFNGYNEGLRT